MHETLRLYDTALQILKQEAQALDGEDDDLLASLLEKRTGIMAEAWEKRAGCDTALLIQKLESVHAAQAKLAQQAAMQRETLRLALQNSKKQGNRLAGYGKIVSGRDTAFTIVKEG